MPTRSPTSGFADTPDSPALRATPVVPGDNPILPLPKGIYVGTGGDVTLRAIGSSADVTYKNLANGSYIAVRAQFIRAAGTTATDLIAEA
ncbi:hypothetical protein [Novosphingobium sp.]|uniref:spike base protein, RCAP_Rcc01079 family n=1 Tax=Novosphingobium sp. TaxID=1874826 RepID=UPI0038B7553D